MCLVYIVTRVHCLQVEQETAKGFSLCEEALLVFQAQDPDVERYTKFTVGVSVSQFGQSNKCVVLYHYCFMFLIVCMFVMTCDGEHLFICSFSIYISSGVRCVFRSHFSIELFVFLLSFKSSLYIFNNSP